MTRAIGMFAALAVMGLAGLRGTGDLMVPLLAIYLVACAITLFVFRRRLGDFDRDL